jgi:hypothetical protein
VPNGEVLAAESTEGLRALNPLPYVNDRCRIEHLPLRTFI